VLLVFSIMIVAVSTALGTVLCMASVQNREILLDIVHRLGRVFTFFQSLAVNDVCNFGGFNYDPAYAVPSTSAEMTEDPSAANVTMAY
jgi:hypothetical protein